MFKFFTKNRSFEHSNEIFTVKKPEPLLPKALNQLFLFSTIVFVFSALFVQFLMTLQTAILLRHFSISFNYNLFGISFSSVNGAKWPEERIFLVFGFGTLVFFVTGLLLWFLTNKIKHISWKLRLFLTWLSFLLIHTLPLGMFSGIFFFDGFGIAFNWLFNEFYIRLIFAFLAIVVIMILRPLWMSLFLRSAYSTSFFSGRVNRGIFIMKAVVQPWIAGFIILMPFALQMKTWFWLVYLVGLGLVLLPLFGNQAPLRKSMIDKYDKKIFNLKYPLPLFLVVIVLLWIANFLSKTSF